MTPPSPASSAMSDQESGCDAEDAVLLPDSYEDDCSATAVVHGKALVDTLVTFCVQHPNNGRMPLWGDRG